MTSPIPEPDVAKLVKELRPCPFCGSDDIDFESRNCIECRDCEGQMLKSEMNFDLAPDEAERIMVEAWNGRSDALDLLSAGRQGGDGTAQSQPGYGRGRAASVDAEPSAAVLAVADAWASINGKLDEYRDDDGSDTTLGYRDGYQADAQSLVERILNRGFRLVATESPSTPQEASKSDDRVEAIADFLLTRDEALGFINPEGEPELITSAHSIASIFAEVEAAEQFLAFCVRHLSPIRRADLSDKELLSIIEFHPAVRQALKDPTS